MNNLIIDDNDPIIKIEIDSNDPIDMKSDEVVISKATTNNYNDLSNKPSLNNVVLIGNVNETDPTVPSWAKEASKPSYKAEDVGAVNESNTIPLEEIEKLINTIWS